MDEESSVLSGSTLTAGETQSAEEDHAIRLKAPEQLLDLKCEMKLSLRQMVRV